MYDIDISKVKARLSNERVREAKEAREYGRELGMTWAAEDADPSDLEALVVWDLGGICLDDGDSWQGARKLLPSLDNFLSSIEDEDDEFRRYYRAYPLPLLEGFFIGAAEVLEAVGDLGETT